MDKYEKSFENKKLMLYLAPLNKLGNSSFRTLCLNHGADFVFSEMIKVDELLNGCEVQLKKTTISIDEQSKTILQILCEDIDLISAGIGKLVKINPNMKEINYNMGCPQSSLCKADSGGGIIKNPQKLKNVCERLFDACSKYGLIASVKTRIGISRENINIYENVRIISNSGIKKVYLHGRVLNDGYGRMATYEEIGKVVLENPDLKIVGNGDIVGVDSLNNLRQIGHCDEILIGRAALENPRIFEKLKKGKGDINNDDDKSGSQIENKIELILEYLYLSQKDELSLSQIKSNLAYLTKGIIGGASVRKDINNILDVKGVIKYFQDFK